MYVRYEAVEIDRALALEGLRGRVQIVADQHFTASPRCWDASAEMQTSVRTNKQHRLCLGWGMREILPRGDLNRSGSEDLRFFTLLGKAFWIKH